MMTQTRPDDQRSGFDEKADPVVNGGEPGDATRPPASVDEAQPTEAMAPTDETQAPPATAREAELEAELDAAKDRLLRTLAEMENLRRRTQREVEDARKYAISGFARELLDIADNLARALESIPAAARENIELIRNLADGVAMTHKMLMASFERHQIEKVAPEPGEKFDHNRHQAMFEVETDQHPPGSVAQVMQPGYTIADRLLRPALVGVAKAPSGRTRDDGEPEAAAEGPRDGGKVVDLQPGKRVDTTA